MNGGLLNKSISRAALAAAAGLFMGGMALPSAKAADLGGDCCADLEERVAELEATTARKGNRRMSLTITGQVHRGVLYWDDGHNSRTYLGLDNTNSSSRFSFLGEAKVSSTVKMGFEVMIEIEAGGTSSKVNQYDEDGKLGGQINGVAQGSFNVSNTDAYFGDARRVAWWIEDSRVGRITIGRYESAGVVNTIDLGGISAGASSSMGLINGGFVIRGPQGQFYGGASTAAFNWAALTDPSSSQGRTELVRYDSPTIAGFIASASIAEAGDYWGVMLRYAGEFSGVRIAAGIGYEDVTDRQTSAACFQTTGGAPPAATCAQGSGGANAAAGPIDLTVPDPEVKAWGASLALLHVPSGLFAQGHYMAVDFSCNGNGLSVTNYWGQSSDCRKDATQWLIQAGIAKNWFGLGNTALYGEYGVNNGFGAGDTLTYTGAPGGTSPFTRTPGRNFSAATLPGGTAVNGVTDTEMTIYGLGMVQNIDAAATELYVSWRHFSADVTCIGDNAGGGVCNAATPAKGATAKRLPTEDGDFIFGGARMKF